MRDDDVEVLLDASGFAFGDQQPAERTIDFAQRVEPSVSHINGERKEVYDLRMQMADWSHTAFRKAMKEGDFEVFREKMEPLLEAHSELYRLKGWERIKNGDIRRGRWVGKWVKSEIKMKQLLIKLTNIGS